MSKTKNTILLEYFQENKFNLWSDWLEFDSSFRKSGKQGLVGLFRLKNNPKIKCIFKISQYINHLTFHEFTIMTDLQKVAMFCPHFYNPIGVISCKLNPEKRKEGNPFDIKDVLIPIQKDVLLVDYIEDSVKFHNYIKSVDIIPEKIIYSTIKQVLFAVLIAQKKVSFTHYDLHSYNIMMQKCDENQVNLYVIDNDNQFCIPTFGHNPIIIDYGFSYSKSLKSGPLWTSLTHTDVGFLSNQFDPISDPKLFLVSVAYEINQMRNTKNGRKFNRIIKNIFDPLKLDWTSGWDDTKRKSAVECLLSKLESYNKHSNLFYNYEQFCIEIIQSLIILPLEQQNYTKMGSNYSIFLTEWKKFETLHNSDYFQLAILKDVIDSARHVRVKYFNSETRYEAIEVFKCKIDEIILKYNNKKTLKIHYEKLLCSLFIFARNVEGFLFDQLKDITREKEKNYKKMLISSIEQIYAAIEFNIPTQCTFTENTIFNIINCETETEIQFKPQKNEIEEINKMHPISRGKVIWNYYLNSLKSI